MTKESCREKNFQCQMKSVKNFRAISTGQLHPLRDFHLRPINVVVYHDPSHLRDRDLILESVSRLYAFSVYLIRT